MPQMRFQFGQSRAGEQYRMWSNRINKQPSWIARVVMLAMAMLILIPIFIFIIGIMIFGFLLFIVLSLVNTITSIFTGGKNNTNPTYPNPGTNPPRPNNPKDGRENVRVIIPDDQ